MPQSTQLYKWVPGYRQWWKCERLIVVRNCCMARMLPRETELVSEWTGLSGGGGGQSVKRFERSNELDTALYKYISLSSSCSLCRGWGAARNFFTASSDSLFHPPLSLVFFFQSSSSPAFLTSLTLPLPSVVCHPPFFLRVLPIVVCSSPGSLSSSSAFPSH